MFQGGYSTMVAAIGNAVHTLLTHPEALSTMQDRPSLLRTGTEELVRYDGPVQGTSRIAMEDYEIGGVAVRAGDAVTLLFAAANRDPAQFPDAACLRLDRSPNQHLGYGWGTHACLGAAGDRDGLGSEVRVIGHGEDVGVVGPVVEADLEACAEPADVAWLSGAHGDEEPVDELDVAVDGKELVDPDAAPAE